MIMTIEARTLLNDVSTSEFCERCERYYAKLVPVAARVTHRDLRTSEVTTERLCDWHLNDLRSCSWAEIVETQTHDNLERGISHEQGDGIGAG